MKPVEIASTVEPSAQTGGYHARSVAAGAGDVLYKTCWLQASDNFCETMRAITSVGPPGEKPTIMRTGLLG